MNAQVFRSFSVEFQKIAADLSTEAREHIAPKNFALSSKQSDTGKPAYPIEDKRHASNALARVKQFGDSKEKSEVYKDVARKYPGLAAKSSVPAVKEKTKEGAGMLQRLGKGLASDAGTHKAELAGLGILAAPSLDEAQAHARAAFSGAKGKEEVRKRELLPHGAKPLTEIGGLGVLAGPSIAHLMGGKH